MNYKSTLLYHLLINDSAALERKIGPFTYGDPQPYEIWYAEVVKEKPEDKDRNFVIKEPKRSGNCAAVCFHDYYYAVIHDLKWAYGGTACVVKPLVKVPHIKKQG